MLTKTAVVMSPLHKYHRYTRASGVCGVEVEVEFLRANREPSQELLAVWKQHVDGSLRHSGVEYTMHKPMSGAAKDKAIVAVCEFIHSQPHVVDSPRTSVHVHKNVQRLTPLQIWNTALLYWIVEPALMEFCGPERVGNPFCLRLLDALNLVDVCIGDLQKNTPFVSFKGNDDIRYSSLNLQPLMSFGSLEFRGMRGIYDSTVLIPWTDLLSQLVYKAANMWDTPESILDEYFASNREDFFKKVLGQYYDNMFKPYFRVASDEIDEVVESLLPFAYFHDWNKWIKKMEDNLVKNKERRKSIASDGPLPRGRAQIDPGRVLEAVVQQPVHFVMNDAAVNIPNPVDNLEQAANRFRRNP